MRKSAAFDPPLSTRQNPARLDRYKLSALLLATILVLLMPVVYWIRYRDEFTDDMSTVGAGQRIAYILRVLIRGPALRRHLSSPKFLGRT